MRKIILLPSVGLLILFVGFVVLLWMFSAPRLLFSEEIPLFPGAYNIEKKVHIVAFPDNIPGRSLEYTLPVRISTKSVLDFYAQYFPAYGWSGMVRRDADLAEYFVTGESDYRSKLCFTRDTREQLFIEVWPDPPESPPNFGGTIESMRAALEEQPAGLWQRVRIMHSVYPGSALPCDRHAWIVE